MSKSRFLIEVGFLAALTICGVYSVSHSADSAAVADPQATVVFRVDVYVNGKFQVAYDFDRKWESVEACRAEIREPEFVAVFGDFTKHVHDEAGGRDVSTRGFCIDTATPA